MDDHQRSDGIPVTRFTLQSIYAQSDDEKLQFEYESGNTNILVSCTMVYTLQFFWSAVFKQTMILSCFIIF